MPSELFRRRPRRAVKQRVFAGEELGRDRFVEFACGVGQGIGVETCC